LIVTKDGFEEHLWHPELTFGLPMYEPGLVRVESPEESARRILAVFSKSPEAPADEAYIVANAAAALWLTGRASSPIAGVSVAREVIESGLALAKLNDYAKYTQSVSG
jgi:anthranilate phosphoribosyltransferase